MAELWDVKPRPPLDERDMETRLAEVRLVTLELEGVVSDGTVTMGPDGGQSFGFQRSDLMALRSLEGIGVRALVLCRHDLPAAEAYCALAGAELAAHKGDKGLVLQLWAHHHGYKPYEVLYIGADMDDLEPMFQVGVAACPGRAGRWVAAAAQVVAAAPGGAGALREICDMLLAARKPVMEE